MTLVFEEPPAAPPSAGRPVSEKWAKVTDALRSAEGKWARVAPLDGDESFETPGQSNGLANRIRKGQSAAFRPAGHFQAVSRPHEDGHGVWARYVGEDYEDDPVADYAEKYKLAELKAQAKERDLKVSGTRRELAERILDYDAEAASEMDDDESDAE